MQKKRTMVMIFGLFSVIAGVVMFVILSGGFGFDSIFVILILVLFLIWAIPQFLSSRHDSVADDELSKKSLRLASSRSFYISIYMWLALLWFEDMFESTEFHIAFGIGVMAIIFIINALVIKFTGVKD